MPKVYKQRRAEAQKRIGIVTAEDLMSDYQRDAYQADEKYKDYNGEYSGYGRLHLVLIGTVKKYRKEEMPYHVNQFVNYIHLYASMDSEVRCVFGASQTNKLRDIKVGDTVKIAGYIRINRPHQILELQRTGQALGGLQREIHDGIILYYVVIGNCVLVPSND